MTAVHALGVDNYGGGFTRVLASPIGTETTATVHVATEPGTGGEVFPDADSIPDAAAVWADFGGALGHVRNGDGSDVLGADLKAWIASGAVLTVHRDNADPSHPVLAVTSVEDPAPPVVPPAVPVPPTVADLAAYLGVDAGTPGLADAIAVAVEAQASRCLVDPYTAGLAYAATRRAARTYAARNHLLGTVDAGDFGTFRIARWDAEIDSAEAPYLKGGFS
jgi:hypothetical protein